MNQAKEEANVCVLTGTMPVKFEAGSGPALRPTAAPTATSQVHDFARWIMSRHPRHNVASLPAMSSPPLRLELLPTGDPSTIRRCSMLAERLSVRFGCSRGGVQSAVIATLTALLEQLKDGDVPADPQKCVENAVRRVNYRRHRHRQRIVYGLPGAFYVDHRARSPSLHLADSELLNQILALVDALPEPVRHAIIATSWDGRTLASVAAELQIKPGTLRKQVSRAREKLLAEVDRDPQGDPTDGSAG